MLVIDSVGSSLAENPRERYFIRSIISTGLRPTEGREGNRERDGSGLKAVKIKPQKSERFPKKKKFS